MRNKRFAKLIACILVFAQMLAPVQTALAAGNDVSAYIRYTNAVFDLYDSTGTPIPSSGLIPQDAKIKISFVFEVEDVDEIHVGDFFTKTLPPELTSIASFVPITGTDYPLTHLYGGVTYTIGYLTVTAGGTATITFADGITLLSDVGTDFSIDGDFRPGAIGSGESVSFTLHAGGHATVISFEDDPAPPVTPTAGIEKAGGYDPESNEIAWIVTVNSGGLPESPDTLVNVTVRDVLGPNQAYKSSSLAADKVRLEADGSYAFSLGDVTGTTFFTITTTPAEGAFGTEGSKKTLTNDVELYEEGTDDPLDTYGASVEITTDWIRKSGERRADGGDYYIDWRITLNHNYRTIPAGATVTDTIPDPLKPFLALVTSGEYAPKIIPANPGGSFHTGGPPSLFTYTFGSDATGIQTITFTTKVLSPYFEQQAQTGFTNTARLTIGASSYQVTSDKVGVGTSLLSKAGKGYDPATQLITWEMAVNGNGKAIDGATIVDEIGPNQVFYEGFAITRKDGSATESLTKVTDPAEVKAAPNRYHYDADTRLLTIFLGDLGADHKPAVTFKTRVTKAEDCAGNKTDISYRNTMATLTGVGISPSETANAEQKITSKVLAKTSTGYDYGERHFTWEVIVNQNKMNMPNAVVTDTIPLGQEYVEGSMRIGADEPGGKLTVSPDKRALTIALGNINQEITITFKTKVTDLSVFLTNNGNVTFSNNASLTPWDGAHSVSVAAQREVGNRAIEKKLAQEYTKANGFIGWEVFINPHQAPLVNAKLRDELQAGLELDVDSVKLYAWDQDALGNMTVNGAIPSGAFSFTYNYGTRVFELSLPNGPQGYCLTFNTDVLSPGKYSNTVSFSGSSSINGSAPSNYVVTYADITFSSTGRNGSITVTKQDEDGRTVTASETIFELLDSMKNVKQTKTTVNGVAKFDKLKLRTYYIREKTPPKGFSLDSTEFEVVVEGTAPDTLNPSVNVSNRRLRAAITMHKETKAGIPLSGGLFGIYAAADAGFTAPLRKAPAVSGVVTFADLLPGSYKIREISPPPGYRWSNEVRDAALTLDDVTNTLADVAVLEALANEPAPDDYPNGSIQLLKTDGNGRPLFGAQFGLYSASGTLLKTAVSDSGGVVLFFGVPYGTYTVKELAAPDGYALSEAVLAVSVPNGGVVQANPYVFVNHLKVLPRTGSFWDSSILLALGGMLVLAGGWLLLRPGHKNKKRDKQNG